jgi:predicted nucleic acid-binding protein
MEEVTIEGRKGARSFAHAEWLEQRPLEDSGSLASLRLSLGRGESEAILLAEQTSAVLLIDDRRGRELATLRGLRLTGTVGVLALARQQGLLQAAVAPHLDALLQEGIYLGHRVVREALKRSGES